MAMRLLPLALFSLLGLALFACGDDAEADFRGASAPQESPGEEGAIASDADGSDSARSLAGSTGLPQDDAGFDSSSQAGDRKIIYTASLRLEAEDVQAAFASVEQTARAAAGFVESSSIGSFTDDEGREYATATITIRIPVDRYDSTLAAIRKIPGSTVKSEDSSATEVTEEYTDLQSRLRNLERVEAQYLTLLEDARTIQDILTVNDRIDSVRSQIEQTEGRLRLLDDLIDMATVSVSIQSPDAPPEQGDEGPKSFGDAFGDAWGAAAEAGRDLLAAGAVLLVAVIWLAIPVLVVAAIALFFQRRSGGASAAGSPPASPDEDGGDAGEPAQ